MSVVIRPATLADLPSLATVLAPLPLFRAYGLDASALEARFRGALERGEGLLVAVGEDAGGPLGVCWFLTRGTFGTGAYLRTLALGEGHQGSGLGTRLLAAYEAGCGAPPGGYFLLTSDFNTAAQRFYQRHGYRQVGALPDFATPGVAELVFWKPRAAV
ncbi:GNAT family N-acetyltransferase [Archangium primigenium]|uniref:GNAT family N-acetyltransferase n=1 Tax=[Archangium] primigenium TaxID=2792470 RepID=UPI00195CB841|nr:GNAT family N-acetyltransferase [Archangium primigenium]MBM7114547.1 GNAT family N-acetyltransferase [Archangium primigenium]